MSHIPSNEQPTGQTADTAAETNPFMASPMATWGRPLSVGTFLLTVSVVGALGPTIKFGTDYLEKRRAELAAYEEKRRADAAAYQSALQRGSTAALAEYLAKFPDGIHVAEAKEIAGELSVIEDIQSGRATSASQISVRATLDENKAEGSRVGAASFAGVSNPGTDYYIDGYTVSVELKNNFRHFRCNVDAFVSFDTSDYVEAMPFTIGGLLGIAARSARYIGKTYSVTASATLDKGAATTKSFYVSTKVAPKLDGLAIGIEHRGTPFQPGSLFVRMTKLACSR